LKHIHAKRDYDVIRPLLIVNHDKTSSWSLPVFFLPS